MTIMMEQLEATTFTTPSDHELRITRIFDASADHIFDAWTNPKHLPNWLLGPGGWTMPVCDIDLRPGGAWRFGWRNKDGDEMSIAGVYREIRSPRRLVSSESWGEDWPETTNTLELSETNNATRITLTILYPTQEARDDALETGMKRGIAASFNRLADYLRSM
jgi:uncharacterized protein YndB with AHSA1/START domain